MTHSDTNGKHYFTVISPNLIMIAEVEDGRLVKSIGTKVKAEPIEMNYVKVIHGDEVTFWELGPNVRWMDEEASDYPLQ